MTIDDIITEIIRREGGFVDHPNDRGGPTKYGITLGTLARWRQQPVTDEDVKALPELEARAIYHQRYIVGPGYMFLREPLRMAIVDWGVLSGPPRATRGLQRALGVKEDGIIGRETLEALARLNPKDAAFRLCAEQARQVEHLLATDRTQAVFANGWRRRLLQKLAACAEAA